MSTLREALEADPEMAEDEQWNAKIAVWTLACMARDPEISGEVRIAAIQELEICMGRGERNAQGRFVKYPNHGLILN